MEVIDTPPGKNIGDEYIDRDGKKYEVVSLGVRNVTPTTPIPSGWMYSPICKAWVKPMPQEEER